VREENKERDRGIIEELLVLRVASFLCGSDSPFGNLDPSARERKRKRERERERERAEFVYVNVHLFVELF